MIGRLVLWIGRLGAKNLLLIGAAVIIAMALISFVRDPLGLRRARLNDAEARATAAEQAAWSTSLEAVGERQTSRRVGLMTQTMSVAQQATADLRVEASKAADGGEPLDPARAARLAAHDQALCRLAALEGCGRAP